MNDWSALLAIIGGIDAAIAEFKRGLDEKSVMHSKHVWNKYILDTIEQAARDTTRTLLYRHWYVANCMLDLVAALERGQAVRFVQKEPSDKLIEAMAEAANSIDGNIEEHEEFERNIRNAIQRLIESMDIDLHGTDPNAYNFTKKKEP